MEKVPFSVMLPMVHLHAEINVRDRLSDQRLVFGLIRSILLKGLQLTEESAGRGANDNQWRVSLQLFPASSPHLHSAKVPAGSKIEGETWTKTKRPSTNSDLLG